MFDETTLLAEVTKVWGEHGAHRQVLAHLLKENRRLEDALVSALEALRQGLPNTALFILETNHA